jgi:hypothetical protein
MSALMRDCDTVKACTATPHFPGRLTHSFFSGVAFASTTNQSSRAAVLAEAACSSSLVSEWAAAAVALPCCCSDENFGVRTPCGPSTKAYGT